MEKQRWEESEKRQGGSRSRLARAAGAEPSGQMRDEKMHAAVARSTFPKSKCTKRTMFGTLLDIDMSKKCMPLWREADLEVKHTMLGARLEFERKSARCCGAATQISK